MPRFLGLDDDPASAELVACIAQRSGYEGRAIVDASALADLVVNWRPDVISVDLDMPGLDGAAVITLLSVMAYPGALLIVSGMDRLLREAACEFATRSGIAVVHELGKPLDSEQLKHILAALAATRSSKAAKIA